MTLAAWRRKFSISQAKLQSQQRKSEFTSATLCSGGCLDTLAAIRAGFDVLWGSEVNLEQQAMFEDLTNGSSLGDTFGDGVKTACWVHYIKSGQPCINYSRSGDQTGARGKTGYMFTKQVEVILLHLPWAFCLEISDNAPFVNSGAEIKFIREQLKDQYVVKGKTVRVWHFGDPSNRQRLFMIGILRSLGQVAYEFEWPESQFNLQEAIPIARRIAVPDSLVEDQYWRYNYFAVADQLEHSNDPGRLLTIARIAPNMGYSSNPHTILSWDGLLNGQTTYNGGGQRPSVDWTAGSDIIKTRLTVPIETVRGASLDDSPNGYREWVKMFHQPTSELDQDQFLRLCVNNGVPLRTSVFIDLCVLRVLQKAKALHSQPAVKWASLCWQQNLIRKMLFDTGANGSLNFKDVKQNMLGAYKAIGSFTVANKESLDVGESGKLGLVVLNTTDMPNVPQRSGLQIETTTADVKYELFSFDQFYRQGWGLQIDPISSAGIHKAFMFKNDAKIPIVYDWEDAGGFWLHYIMAENNSSEHRQLLEFHNLDEQQSAIAALAGEVIPTYDAEQTVEWQNRVTDSEDVVDVIIAQHEEDRAIRGTKAGLKSKQQKQPILDFHSDYGHIGGDCQKIGVNCLICKLVKGASRKIYSKVDPHRETRPGYKWHMDTITFSHRSEEGCKFLTVLRCEACDYYVVFCHYLKDDIRGLFERWVVAVRKDPAYNDCRYKMVSQLNLDNAGEWARNCDAFQLLLGQLGIDAIYSCPDRKESAALAERSVGIVEIVVKALLMEKNLPTWWWQKCAKGAEFLLNRFPTSKLSNMSTDGDSPRPLELFSRFTYSRRQIDRELSYWVSPGTPALVQTTAKGSFLGPKTRWGVAKAMLRDQVIWMCPYKHTEFASKSFAAFKLKMGMNFATFLGLPKIKPSRKATAIPVDFTEKLMVILPSDDWYKQYLERPSSDTEVAHKPTELILEMKVAGHMVDQPPILRVVETDVKSGSVELVQGTAAENLLDSDEQQLSTEQEIPELAQTDLQHEGAPDCLIASKSTQITSAPSDDMRNCYVDLFTDTPDSVLDFCNAIDAEKVKRLEYTTKGTETFVRICKNMKLSFQMHNLYRLWLIDVMGFDAKAIVFEKHQCLRAGMVLPYPSGSKWIASVAEGSRKSRRAMHSDFDANDVAVNHALQWVETEIHKQRNDIGCNTGKYCFSIHKGLRAMAVTASQFKKMKSKATAQQNKAKQAVSQGKLPNPANTRQALDAPDGDRWVASMANEFYGLVDMGVVELGFSKESLIQQGITAKPVPCGPYFNRKPVQGGEGEVLPDKLKTRIAIKGHPGNMQKGVHYDQTFSATPQESTCRVLCALTVYYSLFRDAFDITKAFCWADLPEGDQIALNYPEGFKEFDKDGNELFMILRKNLYGHPAAGRQYGKQRDKTLLQRFNEKGWKCIRTRMDPCLFLISRMYQDKEQWLLVLVHVDDCDMAGTTTEILADCLVVCRSIWDLTQTNPDHMLGVRRRITRDPVTNVVQSCEIDMIPFVEGMYKAFEDKTPAKVSTLPWEANFDCSRADEISEEESQAVLNAGYQIAMGMLLWAVRRVHEACRVGVSKLCRVMAKPSWRAFYAAMYMIKWIHEHRTQGLMFTQGINLIPLVLVDASNKPDPYDKHCQYAYLIMMMGGPVSAISKKLRHVGLSSEHNEYMALAFAMQALVWLRQLFEELNMMQLIALPTVVLEDNKPAILLSHEDMVSPGNQYIQLAYHYSKEVQEEGHADVQYVNTLQNIADMGTKCNGTKEFKALFGPLTGYDTTLIEELCLKAYGKQ